MGISDYFTDRVIILTRTIDAARRVTETEASHFARVERTDLQLQNNEGETVQANYLVFMSPGTSVDIKDHMRIEQINGTATNDTRQFPILRIFKANRFDASHLEVAV